MATKLTTENINIIENSLLDCLDFGKQMPISQK